MFRWAGNIFCALSLLLFLALLIYGTLYGNVARGVWLKRTDVVHFAGKEQPTPHIYYFNLVGRQFVFGHWRNPEILERIKRSDLLEELQQMRANMSEMKERMPDNHRASMNQHIANLEERISRHKKDEAASPWSQTDGFHVGYHDGWYSTHIASIPSFAGMKYDSLPGWAPPSVAFRCFVPIWYVLPVFLIAPAWRGMSIWRRYRRRRANVCSNCGYDLRATPDLCPECGNAPANESVL